MLSWGGYANQWIVLVVLDWNKNQLSLDKSRSLSKFIVAIITVYVFFPMEMESVPKDNRRSLIALLFMGVVSECFADNAMS